VQVDPDTQLVRGPQYGYNICNSTTENQNSLCQTAYVNSPSDFCLWAPATRNSTIADTEGEEVAWCTSKGHGTRLIPAGAIKGLQYLTTPDYIQIVGFMDQTDLNLAPGDFGGELDPHGADLRGNPLGASMWSNAWTGSFLQVIEWTNFMGGNAFCMKICDPRGVNAANYCQHIYDRIGCAYNAPNNAQTGVFESCDSDDADFPGVYTSNGQVMTYTQPPESLGPIATMPYTARIPSSSNCKTLTSSVLFAGLPTATVSGATSSATGSMVTKAVTGTGSASTPSSSSSTTSDGTVLVISGVSFLGIIFSALFLA